MENTPASLVVQCLRSVVINMESMPRNELKYLPSPYQELVQPESFVQAKFKLWPRYIRGESTTVMAKKSMIVSEILLLLRQKLQLGSDSEVCLFKSCLPLEEDDVIQEENGDYGCVFVPSKMPKNIPGVARIGKSRDVTRTAQSNKDVSITVKPRLTANPLIGQTRYHGRRFILARTKAQSVIFLFKEPI